VARQKKEVEAKVVDCYERVALSLLLSPSREFVSSAIGVVGIATFIAATAAIAAAIVSVGRGTLVQGNF
jgi:hypothetical protein